MPLGWITYNTVCALEWSYGRYSSRSLSREPRPGSGARCEAEQQGSLALDPPQALPNAHINLSTFQDIFINPSQIGCTQMIIETLDLLPLPAADHVICLVNIRLDYSSVW